MRTRLKQRDYNRYNWRKGELAVAILISVAVTIFFSFFFYRSIIAVLPMTAIGVFCFRSIRQKKIEKTKTELTVQFRECILSVSASLRAGYAVENAFRECRPDMALLYGDEALICGELDYIRRGLDINIVLEELLADLAERSGSPEIREFVQIFVLAKRNGGSMPEIIRGSAAMIGQKIELQQEIATMLSGKQMEQNIMKLMPFGILLYISLANHGYFDVLYHNWQGVVLMTGCLGVYLLAYVMGERIMGKIRLEMGQGGGRMYVIGCVIAVCCLVLGILSRREVVEQDVSRILIPFHRMAVYIYKKLCVRRIPFLSSDQVEKDLRSLYPGEGKESLKTKYYIKKLSLSLAILFVGTLLGVLVRYNSRNDILLDEEGRIPRGDYREGSVEVRLRTGCGESGKDSFQIEVAPLLLTENEVQALSEELWNRLPEYILGENEALDRVSTDLTLEENYGDYPFSLEWESHSPAVVGSTGRVYPVEEPTPVVMTVRMNYGEFVREEKLRIEVVPITLTAVEQRYAELNSLLIQSEYDSRGEEVWSLPEEWQGKAVSWHQEVEDYSVILWILTIMTAVSVYVMSDQDLHRQQEQRKKQMQKDYPDIVHKLVLYAGAGMTTRGAFQKIAGDYERKKEAGNLRPAYEEMLYACRELHSGVSEASAYEHFGKRTGLQEYIRLSTLLTQNLKKGNSTLLERLREEADKAGEERLQNCKRLGEEAGTKLLVPMVLMLLVVMVMIMIPAFSAI